MDIWILRSQFNANYSMFTHTLKSKGNVHEITNIDKHLSISTYSHDENHSALKMYLRILQYIVYVVYFYILYLLYFYLMIITIILIIYV